MMAVDVRTTPAFSAGVAHALFEGAFAPGLAAGLAGYDVSQDGQRFLMVRERSRAGGAEVHVVLGALGALEAGRSER